ncbi:hypothetical protein BG004_007328, partial [Podila humilis]
MSISELNHPHVKVLHIPELVQAIAVFLRPLECRRARLVARAFRDAFTPFVSLHLQLRLKVDIGKHSSSISQKDLARVGHLVRMYTTQLDHNCKEYREPIVHPQMAEVIQQCQNIEELHIDWTGSNSNSLQDNPDLYTSPDLPTLFSGHSQIKRLLIRMWRLNYANSTLTIINSANMINLQSLTLTAHRYHPCQITPWTYIEDLLDRCPMMRELDIDSLRFDRLAITNVDWRGDYSITPSDIPTFKVYPRLESLRLEKTNLSAKGLVYLSNCFPQLESLKLDRINLCWYMALHDEELPPVEDTPNPEYEDNAKFLSLLHLKRLKLTYTNVSEYQRATWSLVRTIRQLPSLIALDCDGVYWTIFNLRQMAEHCSQPGSEQFFERLWIDVHFAGRNTHWDLQSVLNLPCFQKLKELHILKEFVLGRPLRKSSFHFASTLTTLRFGLTKVRFDDRTISALNRDLLPNMPHLQVLQLDSKLNALIVFNGLGFCPEEEEKLPEATEHNSYLLRKGKFAGIRKRNAQPAPQLLDAPGDQDTLVNQPTAVVDDHAVPPEIQTAEDPSDNIAGAEGVAADAHGSIVGVIVDPINTVVETVAIQTLAQTSEIAVAPQEHLTESQTSAIGSPNESIHSQDSAIDIEHHGTKLRTDNEDHAIVELIDQLEASLSHLDGKNSLQRTTPPEIVSAAPLENERYHPHWSRRERPFLRELTIALTTQSNVTVEDVDRDIINRFRHLEKLTILKNKNMNVIEWKKREAFKAD